MTKSREEIAIKIQAFKRIFRQIMESRRSQVGIAIIIFFGIIAAIGPFFTTLDPVNAGSIHSFDELEAAEANCVPEWYQGEKITHNVYPIPTPLFFNASQVSLWNVTEGVIIEYDQEFGYDQNGCVKITFQEEGNATLSVNFYYPYQIPPKSFRGKYRYFITANSNASKTEAKILILPSFKRYGLTAKSYRASMPHFDYFTNEDMDKWKLVRNELISVNPNLKVWYERTYGKSPVDVIFNKPGNYSFELTIQFIGNASKVGNPTVYVDDVQVIVYGNSFGLLGTDYLARDIFTQLVIGTRISFIIGITAATLSTIIGLFYGLISGYVGGILDEIMMRINDMLLVIPGLPLLLVLVYVLGQSMLNIILVVGCLGWMGFARTVRSAVISLKEKLFIEAARAHGAGRFYIMRRHIIPNVFPLVYVTLAMGVPGAILYEAAISWLGLAPLDVMSWGRMLYEFERSGSIATGALTKWYWVLPPGICIAILSVAFVLLGYALDEILNPRLRETW